VTADASKRPSGNEIREKFLQFFESKGHRRVRSSSLVPHGDPTLLFTNAGMNQFKDVFLGLEKREYTRATTAQKCVRAGGKHNDLENVGFTRRHHTFFEMMGNFSFGDYFKKDAIAYAWELITSPEWYGIPKEKLYVTIFEGAVIPHADIPRDEEAYQCWLSQGIPADRIFEHGMKENFWQMGDTGPCGPCSEIHYDMGPEASDEGHSDCKFPCDCGRFVEIWNLVFMQYDRKAGVKDGVSWFEFSLLPKPCVDTGMGLERVAVVLQGVTSNYDTDFFTPLIRRAAELCTGIQVPEFVTLREGNAAGAASLRVIADHARATTFLINDGVLPSNEGRGYVLRKIMRRAIRHGRVLGAKGPFFTEMVPAVSMLMRSAYPELGQSTPRIQRIVLSEEERFARVLGSGFARLDSLLDQEFAEYIKGLLLESAFENRFDLYDELRRRADEIPWFAYSRFYRAEVGPLRDALGNAFGPGRAKGLLHDLVQKTSQKPYVLRGEKAFELYETYGLPLDLIQEAARDQHIGFDLDGYEKAREVERVRARASWKGTHKEAANPAYAKLAETFKTEPDFYGATTGRDCRIEAIITKNGAVSELKPGESGEVVLDRTVIYAESGGQMADTGAFYDSSESLPVAEVTGAYYPVAGLVAHKVTAKETLRVGDRVAVVADAERRARIMRNHSGTHLVHAALRNILGTHVKQAGSLNAPERLRFDFSHFAPVGQEELRDIEQQVNDEIRVNTQIETGVMSLEEALNSGALAFFGDKYPESNVRVVTIPDPRAPRGFYSKELCGGTHVHRIGDIGVLKIVSEESVAAGVRRIEAVTGIGALEHYQHQANTLREVAGRLNVGEDSLLASVEKLAQTARNLEKELEAQKRKGALSQLDELFAQAKTIKGVKVVCGEVGNVDRDGLRQLVDSLRQKLGSGVVVLGMPEDGKVALIAGVTKDLTGKVHAGKLIQALAKQVGGSGGGRPDLAEAGGKDTSALKNALQNVPSLLEPLL
jgi:alanyl-tRNA synthetase